jgi:hypothetical protein
MYHTHTPVNRKVLKGGGEEDREPRLIESLDCGVVYVDSRLPTEW